MKCTWSYLVLAEKSIQHVTKPVFSCIFQNGKLRKAFEEFNCFVGQPHCWPEIDVIKHELGKFFMGSFNSLEIFSHDWHHVTTIISQTDAAAGYCPRTKGAK